MITLRSLQTGLEVKIPRGDLFQCSETKTETETETETGPGPGPGPETDPDLDPEIDLDVSGCTLGRLQYFLAMMRDPSTRITRVLKPVPTHLPGYLAAAVPGQPWAVTFILGVPSERLVDLMHAAITLRVPVLAFLCGVHVAHVIRQIGLRAARAALEVRAARCPDKGEILRVANSTVFESSVYASCEWVDGDGSPGQKLSELSERNPTK